ncbi:MAG TPA: response regulator [Spirochaetota bacterium]|nr:response regulator [Spirochaetota bacterium]
MDCDRLKILLVEDNIVVSLFESGLLVRSGYDVIAVTSGEAAIGFMKNGVEIDLVLMDVDLGDGMSGIEAASLITEMYHVPLIFYTDHDEPDLFFPGTDIKRFGYISKMASKSDVINVINDAVFSGKFKK